MSHAWCWNENLQLHEPFMEQFGHSCFKCTSNVMVSITQLLNLPLMFQTSLTFCKFGPKMVRQWGWYQKSSVSSRYTHSKHHNAIHCHCFSSQCVASQVELNILALPVKADMFGLSMISIKKKKKDKLKYAKKLCRAEMDAFSVDSSLQIPYFTYSLSSHVMHCKCNIMSLIIIKKKQQ